MTSGSVLEWDHLFAIVGIRSRVAQKMEAIFSGCLVAVKTLDRDWPLLSSSLLPQSDASLRPAGSRRWRRPEWNGAELAALLACVGAIFFRALEKQRGRHRLVPRIRRQHGRRRW
jgi:hypothetical protein